MAPIIYQIASILTTPSGYLLYSIILGLSMFGSLIATWYACGNQRLPEGRRVQQGLLFLVVAQVILFIAAWLAWLGVINTHAYLPPLDQAITLFNLVIIIWLWVFTKPNSFIDKITAIFATVVVLLGALSLVWWLTQKENTSFNTSIPGVVAFYFAIALILIGLILLLWQRSYSWVFGASMMVIMFAGYLAQFVINQSAGDFFWFANLGKLIAYPLLLALPRQLYQLSKAAPIKKDEILTAIKASELDTTVIQSIISLGSETSLQQFYQKVTRVVAQLMDADICLLSMPPKAGGQLIILAGYNQFESRVLDGFTLDGHSMPLLLDAMQTGDKLIIDGSKPSSDLETLSTEVGGKPNAHLLAVPFIRKGSYTELGILVVSRPGRPIWNEKDVSKLTEIASAISSVMSRVSRVSTALAQPGDAQKAMLRTQADYERLQQDYAQLKTEYDALVSRSQGEVISAGLASGATGEQLSLQDSLRKLDVRNRELERLVTRGRPSIEEVEQLKQELHAALADLARIPTTLSKSDQKMLEVQLSAMKHLDDMGQVELVTSIAQEFRQPLSAILGYTELLLGESAGLLGAMQRKFVERIKASIERMGILLNELVQVMAIDGGKVNQTTTKVDIDEVINEAVGNIKSQMSEKNISLRTDLPEKLPAIQANKDALLQILANLLQNACLVTPHDGEIKLFARLEQKETEPGYLLFSVSDQGGGIDKVDLPRVFARKYKMDNPMIKGIGDTGVGLSIVKSLVELYKGRIWVDSKEGIGSTFSVILPFAEASPGQAMQ